MENYKIPTKAEAAAYLASSIYATPSTLLASRRRILDAVGGHIFSESLRLEVATSAIDDLAARYGMGTDELTPAELAHLANGTLCDVVDYLGDKRAFGAHSFSGFKHLSGSD